MSTGRPVIGRRAMVGSIVVIAALAGLPFVVGNVVQRQRINVAVAETEEMASALRGRNLEGAEVLVGAGNVPRLADGTGWANRVTTPLPGLDGRTATREDPWRNQYMVNSGAAASIWVVSAGPNGIVETPFEIEMPLGDDIGRRIR